MVLRESAILGDLDVLKILEAMPEEGDEETVSDSET